MAKLTREQLKSVHVKTIVQNPYIVKALVQNKIVHLSDLPSIPPRKLKAIIGGITPANIRDWLSIVHTIEEQFELHLPDYEDEFSDWRYIKPKMHDKSVEIYKTEHNSPQITNILQHYGIENLRDLLELSPEQIKNLDGIGDIRFATVVTPLWYVVSDGPEHTITYAYTSSYNGMSWKLKPISRQKRIPAFRKITRAEYLASIEVL